MNKTSKILLVIIIILIIIIGILTYFYVNTYKHMLYSADILTKNVQAIENAGLEAKEQEDGSFVLIERETPIERVYE